MAVLIWIGVGLNVFMVWVLWGRLGLAALAVPFVYMSGYALGRVHGIRATMAYSRGLIHALTTNRPPD